MTARGMSLLRSGIDALGKIVRFVRNHGISAIRSALFLASVMVILEHYHVLEWSDVLMLRVLHAVTLSFTNEGHTEPEALVFTIQEELFETEFQSRSPINRLILKEYLEGLVSTFHNFDVLAIDYDLSPNVINSVPEQIPADPPEEHSQTELTRLDITSQSRLDEFLLNLKAEKQIVLIRHLPVVSHELCQIKKNWETHKRSNSIWFGRSELLHYGLLGAVVKYAKQEQNDSFPEVVFTAKKLAAPEATDKKGNELAQLRSMQFTCDSSAPPPRKFGHKSYQPINFHQAAASVKVCKLDGIKAFERCKTNWEEYGVEADKAKVIFFGGHYGKDDIYATPMGELPGVVVQAYTYVSLMKPLKPKHGWAWGIDIVMGVAAGLIFHGIWRLFHYYRRRDRFAPQVILALINFTLLIGSIFGLIFLMGRLLPKGMWINPAPMFIGLYLDSYVSAITTAGGHTSADFLHKLFGIPLGNDLQSKSRKLDLLFHGVLKIAGFWIIIGMAVGILLTGH